MTAQRRLWLRALPLSTLLACTSNPEHAAPTSQRVKLPAGLAARVAGEEIATETVTRIARAQQVPVNVALERAISDAQLAAGAREVFAGSAVVPVLEGAAWSRALLESLQAEAIARGPATDAELAELSALRWQDFDRPEAVRTTHAVVIIDKPEQEQAARALAVQLLETVRGTTEPEEFIRRAQAVPHEGLQVRAERLPPVTRDGRLLLPDGAPPSAANQRLDASFSAAAFALAAGKLSEPIKSVFGYHVILCEARLPELRVPLEDRRRLLADEIQKGRAERAKQGLLDRLSRATPIVVPRSVDDLTARVRVSE